MVIEFFGLPGTGKSTLAQRVREVLRQRNIAVEQITYDLAHGTGKFKRLTIKTIIIASQALHHPIRTQLNIKAVMATRQNSRGDFFKVLFNWLFVSALVHRDKAKDKIQLLDQGIFQALWSVGLSAESPAWMSAMIERRDTMPLPLPQMVIVVVTGMEAIKNRLTTRQNVSSRLEQTEIDSDFDSDVFARAATLRETVLSIVENERIPMVVVTNQEIEDLPVNAALIAEKIERLTTGFIGDARY